MNAATKVRNLLVNESPRPRSVVAWRYAPWLAVGSVCFGAFMGQLDASIVTLTFPAIRGEYGATLAAVQWVSLSYLLTLVALLVGVGRIADRVGRKQMYLYGFAVFTAASAVCGLADSLAMLVIFRVVQAVGAAMLQANSVALVTTSVEPQLRRSALGVQAAAQALGLALGPVVGGLLVAGAGWRWVFLVNVPVGVLGLAAGYLLLPRTRERGEPMRPDLIGPLLLVLGTGGVLLGLSAVSGLDLPTWSVIALVLAGAAALAGFGWWQVRGPAPLIPPRVLRPPAVRFGLVAALCGYLVLFGPLVLVPLLVPESGLAGLVSTALPAGFAVAAVFGGRLVPRRWSGRARCVAGGIGCVVALGALVVLPAAPGPLAGALFVLGLGIGVFTPANNALVMSAIPDGSAGLGGGLVNMGRGFGTAMGVCLVTLVAHLAQPAALSPLGFAALGVVAVILVASAARTT